jgi:membrane associated rhomboid family serine protease
MTLFRHVIDHLLSARIVPVLVAINLAVFLYQQSLSEHEELLFALRHAAVPRAYFDPAWAIGNGLAPTDYTRFIAASFMHHGWPHFLLNMLTLLVFGPPVEARLGHVQFLVLYLGCAVLASVAHVYFNPASQLPVMGASGAIAGLISTYAATSPPARSLAALLLAAAWFIIQVRHGVSELLSPGINDGGIAWWAHIGGFLAGLVMLIVLAPFRRRRGDEPAPAAETSQPESAPARERDWEQGPWG